MVREGALEVGLMWIGTRNALIQNDVAGRVGGMRPLVARSTVVF